MDIFEKCRTYSLANDIRKMGIYPYFHALQSRQDVEVTMEGKRRIMLGSNNYLGLTTNPFRGVCTVQAALRLDGKPRTSLSSDKQLFCRFHAKSE